MQKCGKNTLIFKLIRRNILDTKTNVRLTNTKLNGWMDSVLVFIA